MKTISPTELQTILAAQPSASVIDVRTPVEFSEVHIAAARNVPLDELKPLSLGLSKEQPVYLICRSGQRASKAAQKFNSYGFTQPVVIAGGMLAWSEAGWPALRGVAHVISLERQVRIAAGALVLAGVLLGWFVHVGFFGLSAFVGAGLIFAGITDFCGMGLLLAKMPWNKHNS